MHPNKCVDILLKKFKSAHSALSITEINEVITLLVIDIRKELGISNLGAHINLTKNYRISRTEYLHNLKIKCTSTQHCTIVTQGRPHATLKKIMGTHCEKFFLALLQSPKEEMKL